MAFSVYLHKIWNMKYLVVALFLLLGPFAQAQFSSPSDVTYNEGNETFYVASHGTKEILSYKNSVKTTFISGLTKPNAVLFGTLPLGSGFLVADSNVVRVYTSTGTLLTTISITGAVELSDIVADAKTQALYISDVGRNYIYKITFGGAPFYIPSVTNFTTTGLNKPSSMYFDSSSRSILIVSNVTNTKIQKLNVDTKSLTTAMTTSISMAYGIEKDFEGNYYISSWSNNYVYQVNKYFTASKKLVFYNKPAKFFFDKASDYLYFTCYNCGKLEQMKIHNFAPDNAVEKCAGDSFDVYTSSFAANYGCYGKSNKFKLQVSDKNGSFKNFTDLVITNDTLIPYILSGRVPKGIDAGNYKLRIVSTIPYVESVITKNFVVKAKPNAKAYTQDTAYVCVGSGIKLGDNNPSGDINYFWKSSTGLDNDKLPNPTSTVTAIVNYTMVAMDTVTGCKKEDHVVVKPISNPPADFEDTIMLCKGDSKKIGTEKNGSFDYAWTPSTSLDDSAINNPKTDVKTSTWFFVTVGSGSCYTKDSVFVMVKDKPEIMGWKDTFWKCPEKTITIGGTPNSSYVYKWAPPSGINKINVSNPECFIQENKLYELVVKDEKTNCSSEYKTKVMVYINPVKPVVTFLDDTTLTSSIDADSFLWFKDELAVANSNSKKLVVKESGKYQVQVFHTNGCSKTSEKYNYNFIDAIFDILKQKGIELYPNPVKDKLEIKTKKYWTLVLKDLNGKVIKVESSYGNAIWNMDFLNTGVYLLRVEVDKEVFQLKLMKQ